MSSGQRIEPGGRLPFFEYDTPYAGQNSFRALLADQAPLVLVFMSNFGHPVTRTFISRYAESFARLCSGGLAVVVRSRPERLTASVPEGSLPFTVLCDAEGVLYEYLDIPRRASTLTTCSLEAWSILRKAKKQGYNPPKGALQQLPLTLILDETGTVLFSHYGASLTDVPADCEAMEKLLQAVLDLPEPEYEDEEPEDGGHGEYGDDEDDTGEESAERGGEETQGYAYAGGPPDANGAAALYDAFVDADGDYADADGEPYDEEEYGDEEYDDGDTREF